MDLARTCVYWPGMEADVTDYIRWCLTCTEHSNLPVEMLQPHKVPPRPWVKIGVDFFQDHLGKKHLIVADYFSKFPYVFPVASTHHFKTITHLRELFAAEGIPAIVMSDNRPPFNGEEFRQFAHEFDLVHTTLSPHFHQSNGFIEAMVKKVKNAYKKTDGSPNAQARALLQLHDTPIMADLLSPAEILHGHPTQGTVLSRPSKCVNIPQVQQKLIQLKEKQKENFDKAHRAKDLHVLKVKEKVQFFLNKQGTGPLQWITGTVTEILECRHLYMVQAPNSRAYRRNRAHLKPICHDGSSFQDHLVKKEKKQPKNNSFQDHQPSKVKLCLSRRTQGIWTQDPYCLMNLTYLKHPLHHLHHHPCSTIYPDHHHAHPLHHFGPENHQWSQAQRTPHSKAGKDTSLNQLSSDPTTLTEDSHMAFQLY